jgi:hypothetical protein
MDMPQMTPLRFTLNEQLVVKAAQLAVRHYYPRLLWLGGITGVIMSTFFTLKQQVWTFDRALIQFSLTMAGALALAGLVIAILRYGVVPITARRNFRQQKGLLDTFGLSWTDHDFILEAGQSRTAMPFANLYGFRTSDELTILYHSEMIYHVIPTSTFEGPAMRDAFVQRLMQAGVRRR